MSAASTSEVGFRGTADHDLIPDAAKNFIKSLQRSIRSGGSKIDPEKEQPVNGKHKSELANLVEEQFGKLTERYFKNTAWPAADVMGQFIEDDEQILLLYKELYFRHISAKMTPTVDDKFDSFQNYVDLFNLILSLNTENPQFELPTSWLWDIIDEFIYQFQSFHLFRNKVSQLTPDEVSMLKENEHMWSAQTVLQYLHALVRKASIDLTKKAAEQPFNQVNQDEKQPISHMFKTLGYFSLVGLLRVNTLLCDYPTALKVLDPVDLRANRSLFTSVLACHLTLYYNMGLSYLMARRYVDAIKVFCYFLNYMQASKGRAISKSFQSDLIQKRFDQMIGLLGIAYVLSGAASVADSDRSGGQIVDEHILHDIKDKLDDRYVRMKQGEVAAFEEVLSASAPKFLTVSSPNYDAGVDLHTDALALQLKMFTTEVKQRLNMNDLATYLKLFTTVSINKLSVFLNQDDDATLALLLKLSHKTRAQRWVGGAPGDFVWQHYWDVNFTIVGDTIYVTEHQSQRRYGDFFIRQIARFDDATRGLKALKPARR